MTPSSAHIVGANRLSGRRSTNRYNAAPAARNAASTAGIRARCEAACSLTCVREGACRASPVPRSATVIERTTRSTDAPDSCATATVDPRACMAGSSATAVRPSARGAAPVVTSKTEIESEHSTTDPPPAAAPDGTRAARLPRRHPPARARRSGRDGRLHDRRGRHRTPAGSPRRAHRHHRLSDLQRVQRAQPHERVPDRRLRVPRADSRSPSSHRRCCASCDPRAHSPLPSSR